MGKFNEYVQYILEAEDATTGTVGTANGKVPSGEEIMQTLYAALEERPDFVLKIKEAIQADPELQETLNDVSLDQETRMAHLGKALGIAAETLQAKGLPAGKVGTDFEQRPGLSKLGKQLGTAHQADIERAFWDAVYWINNGTWMKKIETVGRAIGRELGAAGRIAKGMLAPTAKGSTGVFA